MNNEFEILTRFLESCCDEVEGHLLEDPPAEVREQLQRLAKGQLQPQERIRLADTLKQKPQWVARLAEEVKRQRLAASGPN